MSLCGICFGKIVDEFPDTKEYLSYDGCEEWEFSIERYLNR